MHLRSALIVSQSHNAIFTARPIDILFREGDIRGEIGFSGPAGSQSPNGLIQIAFGTLDALMGQSKLWAYNTTGQAPKRDSEQCAVSMLFPSITVVEID